jgi:G-patch domain
MSSTAAD